jgi:hypothetical protein
MSITSGYLPSKPPKKEERFIPGMNDRGFLARFSVNACLSSVGQQRRMLPWHACKKLAYHL